ncbi:hypothetical protein B0H11DRAFT_1920952 [Mycena galericulata]|nr:hypothetical protein B0H11DRAFT_1920952 [Mycena galericulata]
MPRHSFLTCARFELITAITDRDHEIFTTITRARGPRPPRHRITDVHRIAQSCAESTFQSAMKPFKTVNTSDGSSKISLHLCSTYVALLRSCSCHEQVDAAIHILTVLEACTDLHMNRVYVSPNGINEAELIFSDFVTRSTEGAIDWTAAYDDPNCPRRQHIRVYNQMIEAHFRAGAPERAVELLERLMASTTPAAFGPADVLRPRPLRTPRRGLYPMLDALALADHVDDLNRVFLVLTDCAVKDGLRVCDADCEFVYLAYAQHLPQFDDAKAVEMGAFLEILGALHPILHSGLRAQLARTCCHFHATAPFPESHSVETKTNTGRTKFLDAHKLPLASTHRSRTAAARTPPTRIRGTRGCGRPHQRTGKPNKRLNSGVEGTSGQKVSSNVIHLPVHSISTYFSKAASLNQKLRFSLRRDSSFLFPLGIFLGALIAFVRRILSRKRCSHDHRPKSLIEPRDIQDLHTCVSLVANLLLLGEYELRLPGIDLSRVETEWQRLRSDIPEVGEAMRAWTHRPPSCRAHPWRHIDGPRVVVDRPGLSFFRQKLCGGFNHALCNKAKWIVAMMLDPVTGLDPPGAKIRAAEGIEPPVALSKGIGSAVVNYDTNNLHLTPCDWRDSYYNLEERDGPRQKRKTVTAAHLMGVPWYCFKWVDSPEHGGGEPDWVEGVAKAMTVFLFGGRDAGHGVDESRGVLSPGALLPHGAAENVPLAGGQREHVASTAAGVEEDPTNMTVDSVSEWILQHTPSSFQTVLKANGGDVVEPAGSAAADRAVDRSYWYAQKANEYDESAAERADGPSSLSTRTSSAFLSEVGKVVESLYTKTVIKIG